MGNRRAEGRRSWRSWFYVNPGSNRDLRRSARVVRWVLLVGVSVEGAIFVVAPHLLTSGNVSLARWIAPLPVWGVVWLLAALSTLLPRREIGNAIIALTYLLWGITTGATVFTGEMESPAGPLRAFGLAAVFWWLRARAVARHEGTLGCDDLYLPDDDDPHEGYGDGQSRGGGINRRRS